MISTGHTVSSAMIKSQAYDAMKDFAPVGIVGHSAFSVIVPKDFSANDLKGLIDVIKKEPGKYNYATVGVGSTQHLTAELLRQRAGLQAQAVSFRTTGDVVTALFRKDVAFAIDLAHAVKGQVASGELKLIALATAKRFPRCNVPTMIESGMPGFEVNGWYGMVYPAGVPKEVVDKTQKALTVVLSRDNVKKQLEKIGAEAALSSPGGFGEYDRRGGGPLAGRGEAGGAGTAVGDAGRPSRSSCLASCRASTSSLHRSKAWMAGTSPAMAVGTSWVCRANRSTPAGSSSPPSARISSRSRPSSARRYRRNARRGNAARRACRRGAAFRRNRSRC